MVSLASTFEAEFHLRLLDVIYAQWSHLGASFTGPRFDEFPDVIDPEALIWASLEFLHTDPRLAESVLLWLHTHRTYTIRQRLKSRSGAGEPRATIWLAIEQKDRGVARLPDDPRCDPSEPCYGMNSPQQVIEFSESLHRRASQPPSGLRRMGSPVPGPATSLLKARDLMGSDARHFLLLYLLANPRGAPLKPAKEWTGYTSRTVVDTVARWLDAGVVSIDHGICRIVEPRAWEAILQFRLKRIALINWFAVFDASIRLLRDLAKARRVGLPSESTVVTSHTIEAYQAISSSTLNEYGPQSPSLAHLLAAFPPSTGRRVTV